MKDSVSNDNRNNDDAKEFFDAYVQTDSCNCRCFCYKGEDVLSLESTIESSKEFEDSECETDELWSD